MIDMGLIIGDDMIRNKPFYQLYRLSDNEIIRTFHDEGIFNTYLKDNSIKLSQVSTMFKEWYLW